MRGRGILSRELKSAESTLSTSRRLSKSELVARAADWASKRGWSFSAARLNEWMKQGLVPVGVRGRNLGLKPSFAYGHAHYRRVLQLIRLHAAEIRDSDALLVQLFLRRYGVEAHQVREALVREFARARNQLIAPIRSAFADRRGRIPPKRKQSLLKQLGAADPRLMAMADLISQDTLVNVVRSGRDPNTTPQSLPTELKLTEQNPLLHLFSAPFVSSLVQGVLARDPETEPGIEIKLQQASDETYGAARELFRKMRRSIKPRSPGGISSEAEMLMQVSYNALLQREFAAMIFGQIVIHFTIEQTHGNS